MKRALALGAVTGLMAFGVAPVAHAGEITGNQRPTPIEVGTKTGKIPPASECAFSGLDDLDPEDGQEATPETRPRVVQSYGQLIKMIGPVNGAFTPANSGCNKNAVPQM